MNDPISTWTVFLFSILKTASELLNHKVIMEWKEVDYLSMEIPWLMVTWESQKIIDTTGQPSVIIRCKSKDDYMVDTFGQSNYPVNIHDYITTIHRLFFHPPLYKLIYQYLYSYVQNSGKKIAKKGIGNFSVNDKLWNFERGMEILGSSEEGVKLFIESFINRTTHVGPKDFSEWNIKTIDDDRGWQLYVNAYGTSKSRQLTMNTWVVEKKWTDIFLPLIDISKPLYETITKGGIWLEKIPLENIGIWTGAELIDYLENMGYKSVSGYMVEINEEDKFYIETLYP